MINLEHPHIELFEVDQLNIEALSNCEISLQGASETDVVFYNNKNDDKSLEVLKERLKEARPGLLVLAHRPKIKISSPYAVVQEGKFLEAQEYVLNQLFPINIEPKIIAVTGTNGKTTTTFLAQQLLNQVGISSVAIGTTGVWGEKSFHLILRQQHHLLLIFGKFLAFSKRMFLTSFSSQQPCPGAK